MSQRTRSVQWCENRILSVLSKTPEGKEPILLALSAMSMKYEIRNLEEQHNFDLGFFNLLRRKLIVQVKDEQGFEVLKLAA